MLFNLDSFVAEPQLDEFNVLKKAKLLQIGQHYNLTVNLSMGKRDIKKLVLNYLVEEEIFQRRTWNMLLCLKNRV